MLVCSEALLLKFHYCNYFKMEYASRYFCPNYYCNFSLIINIDVVCNIFSIARAQHIFQFSHTRSFTSFFFLAREYYKTEYRQPLDMIPYLKNNEINAFILLYVSPFFCHFPHSLVRSIFHSRASLFIPEYDSPK